MRREKGEMIRVQSILECDRLQTNDNFIQLIICDCKKILEDYFEFRGEPVAKIEKTGDDYVFELALKVVRIKPFDILKNYS